MTRTIFAALALLAATLLGAASAALADTVRLKDGTVYEGVIQREADDFIFMVIKIGEIEHTKFLDKKSIASIERDDEATPAPADAPAKPTRDDGARAKTPRKGEPLSPGTGRVVFVTLEDTVGPFLNADALEESIKLVEDCGEQVDVVVLQFNSGGGALAEVEPLSDVIHEYIKPRFRVVAWIESAISAAAMTATNVEEIYFMPEGNFGAAVAYRTVNGGTESMQGDALEGLLRLGQELSRRGQHDPLILRAMQAATDLSCDIDENGKVAWRNDLEGRYIINQGDGILTFNAHQAEKFGLSRGTVSSKDELLRALGYSEWVEVCPEADEHQQEFRENVARAQVEVQELSAKMSVAVKAGQFDRARRFLSEIRTWVRRAPSLEKYQGLDRDWFRRQEEQLREASRVKSRR